MHGKFKVRKDRILFVDFEMTCWEDAPPPGEQSEIIEIGLAEVDIGELQITRSSSILVRPELSSVSAYCEQLTGLSEARLRKQGRYLRDAAPGLLKNWGSANKAWMAWGSDREAVLTDCAAKGVGNPFSEAFHDIGQQFAFLTGATSAVGLVSATTVLGLPLEGRIHSGEDDAIRAAEAWIAMARIMRLNMEVKIEPHDGPRPG